MCSLCVWGTGNHGELGLGNSIKFSSSPSPIPDIQRYENNTDSSRTHSTGLSMIRIKIERIVCCQPTQLSLSFPSTFCLSTCLSLYLYLFLYLFLYLLPFLCLLNFLYKIFFVFITIPFLFLHNFKYGHPE